jgi:PTS system nitrogen regulatory IIA component
VALGHEAGALAFVFLQEALALSEPAPDDKPITRLLFFFAPSPRAHLELLGQLSTRLARTGLRQLVLEAAPDDEIYASLATIPQTDRRSRENGP